LEQVTAEKKAATTQVFALNQDLAVLRRQYEEAQTELARHSPEIAAKQDASIAKQIKALQEELDVVRAENKIIRRKVQSWNRVICVLPHEVRLPYELNAKVAAFDPKWRFVVLDAGEEQGIRKEGELLVNRNGKLIAKVLVSTVEKDRCIANVMPGWELSEIIEGDTAIPAHPDSDAPSLSFGY